MKDDLMFRVMSWPRMHYDLIFLPHPLIISSFLYMTMLNPIHLYYINDYGVSSVADVLG